MIVSNNTQFKRRVMSQITVVPNVGADLCTKDAIIYHIYVCNVTGGAVAFTVQDKQSTPRRVLYSTNVAANSFLNIPFAEGILMTGGITWVAGTANALESYIEARVKGE